MLSRLAKAQHAGAKAPLDVRTVTGELGFAAVDLAPLRPEPVRRLLNLLSGYLTLLATLVRARRDDVLLVQYPVGRGYQGLLRVLARRTTSICLVHDLESVRVPEQRHDDVECLAPFDVVIAQTPAMQRLLEGWLPTATVTSLDVFDYLLDAGAGEPQYADRPDRLYVVGNLGKTKVDYLYALEPVAVPVAAYGPNVVLEDLPSTVTWNGVLSMTTPDLGPLRGFGLIWDGESTSDLTGQFGEYLRYNSPHKVSFYLAQGLPVVVSEASAMADWVRRSGVGFTVRTIAEAAERVAATTPQEWQRYCAAARAARADVLAGAHTRRAVLRALEILGADPERPAA